MYHVKFLDPHRVDRPGEKWCVVKVGITNCINERLTHERNEFRKYRGLPRKLRITAEDLNGKDDVGDLVLLCTGRNCNGQDPERRLRTGVGLPLGTGIVENEASEAVQQMLREHTVRNTYRNSLKAKDNPGKIRIRGWLAYLCPEKSPMPTAEPHGSRGGLSELIMMRENDMLRIREAFKSNPASFADVREDGPVWALVDEVKQALPPKWHKERVMVQFDRNELTLAPVDVSSLNRREDMRELLGYSRKQAQTISAPELRRLCEEAMAKSVEENGPCPERLAELLPPLELKLWDPDEVKKENEKAPPKTRGRPKKN